MQLRRLSTLVALAASITFLACSAAERTPPAGLDVAPSTVEVAPADVVHFTASLGGTPNQAVHWTVVESGGGTIDAAGTYVAPDTEGTYTVAASLSDALVTAARLSDPTVQVSKVTVRRHARVTVAPQTASIVQGTTLQLTATVSGTTDTAVTWSVAEPGGGSVSSSGTYTAPQLVGTFHAVATSVADPTRSATATIGVTATPPAPAPPPDSGPVYYVQHGGGGTTCSLSAPCGTLAEGVARLTAGATLYIRGATTDSGDAVWNEPIVWTTSGPKGTATARITVAAYPGEIVRIQGRTGDGQFVMELQAGANGAALDTSPTSPCHLGHCSAYVPQYLTFKDLIFDGVNGPSNAVVMIRRASNGFGGPHHIRFQNVEIRNGPMQGLAAGGDYGECLGCRVHHNGTTNSPPTHGIYLAARKWTFDGGQIHDNHNAGIHQWCGIGDADCSDNVFKNIELYANGNSGDLWSSGGLQLMCGVRTSVQNVYVHDHPYGTGIDLGSGAYRVTVTGSTIQRNATSSDRVAGLSIGTESWSGCRPQDKNYEAGDPDVGGLAYVGGASLTSATGNTLSGNVGGNTCSGQIQNAGSQTALSGNTCTP